jgi:hypothetical protein
LARCDCGKKHRLLASNWVRTTSCGCLLKEIRGKAQRTHGMAKTPEYQAWRGMLDRCYREATKGFDRYGGRGIRVCKAWRESFEPFFEEVGRRPGADYSIDRIDNERGYVPGNVRWATREEQARNKRSNVELEYLGRRQCVRAWEKELGLPHFLVNSRLRRGASVEQALRPVEKRGPKLYRFRMEELSLEAWSRKLNIPFKTLENRARAGMPPELIFSEKRVSPRWRDEGAPCPPPPTN